MRKVTIGRWDNSVPGGYLEIEGVFLSWGVASDMVENGAGTNSIAIVELQDGTVATVPIFLLKFTEPAYDLLYRSVSDDELWQLSDRPLSAYPIGTKAQALGGECWIKTDIGWKFNTGEVFPSPGLAWTGKVRLL